MVQITLKDHEQEAHLLGRRIFVGGLLVLLLVGVLVARLYFLQVVQYEQHRTLSETNRVHVQPIAPTRGIIYDRNGLIIADNRPSFNLTVTRERAKDWPKILEVLTEILALSPEDRLLYDKRMRQGRRAFEPVVIAFELSQEQIARIAVNQFRLPGIEISPQFVRHYPQGMRYAHAVGYVGRINEAELKRLDAVDYSGTHHIGKTGIERFYEEALHGKVGYEEVETNARGRVLRVLNRVDSVSGQDIHLTLDAGLQAAAEEALVGRRGALVAIQPTTGEILAMVSVPSFDPNPFVTGIGVRAYADLRDSIDRPLYNRVLRGLYPPGSTIKPMVAVAALDAGVITHSTRVYDPGFYQLPGNSHQYRNWNRTGDGSVDLEWAIMRSNDTYFYSVAHKLGVDRLHDYLSRFGIGQKVSLDLFEESAGLMPSKEWKRARYRQPWYPGETLILGIGQGYMQATPLQLAQATALMATHGKWIRPHLAKTVGTSQPVDPNPISDIVLRDDQFWHYANFGMEQVLHGPRGTAAKVGATAAYRIAGKSGTAQVVAIKQGEKYDRSKVDERHRDHALFIAFAPAENPQIAVAVIVENGESGSGVAAPIVKKVLDAWLLDAQQQLKAEYRPHTQAAASTQEKL